VLCATAETIQEAKAFADQALAAAARKLGPEPLQEGGLVGEFWGHVITRPYMRALHEVAELCYAMGAKEEAVQHYREMLRLNPSDNLGVRYTLSPLLIELDLDREATLLMKTYARDNSAFFLYSKALIQFRKSPNTKTARKAMERAFLSNPNVAAIIVAEGPEAFPDHYTPGSPEEAALIVRAHAGAWNENFEFIPWMLQISLEVIQASYSQ
jgi:tetratricopeptide (TPR) repeat protein